MFGAEKILGCMPLNLESEKKKMEIIKVQMMDVRKHR